MQAAVPALVMTADSQHGVSQHALLVATAVERITGEALRVSAVELETESPPARAHLHFTDRLWGASPEAAAEAIERIAARTRVTVTLHDVPQHSDGPTNFARRSACYRRVIAVAAGVVCNSRHEVEVLREVTATALEAHVIPLPIDAQPVAERRPEGDGTVAVLGFFYPGKGHVQVVQAVARLARISDLRPGVVFLGRASAGHEGDLRRLARTADRLGVALEVTGYLEREELIDRARRTAVPVAAHRHFSASDSINTWISAGRRPIVVDGRYTREVADRRPGTVTMVDGHLRLVDGIAAALRDPSSTWLHPDAVTAPNVSDVASAYLAWWKRVGW
jgi:glycosyltransferase involved in cell wall biosynthesis